MTEQLKRLLWLNNYLISEMPQYKNEAKQFENSEDEQFQLFRSLVNVRPPQKASDEFIQIQNDYLQEVTKCKGIVDINDLEPIEKDIYLWKGDITTLKCDAIVNAANSQLLGCFHPCHSCIDNVIHTYAGVQLRQACIDIIQKQGHKEHTGKAKITPAYNLPCKYVIHTVGPIVYGELTETVCDLLKNCYRSCLELAEQDGLKSIAFCCISTGEFCFPNDKAAEIAFRTVRQYKKENSSKIKVIFNVFKKLDFHIYSELFR